MFHSPTPSSVPYGPLLAEQVAACLRQGLALNHCHREYCGTGLDYHSGQFRYGELWDYSLLPLRTFVSQNSLVAWLARQSDASLARTDHPQPFFRHNQVITRLRLEEFVRPC